MYKWTENGFSSNLKFWSQGANFIWLLKNNSTREHTIQNARWRDRSEKWITTIFTTQIVRGIIICRPLFHQIMAFHKAFQDKLDLRVMFMIQDQSFVKQWHMITRHILTCGIYKLYNRTSQSRTPLRIRKQCHYDLHQVVQHKSNLR